MATTPRLEHGPPEPGPPERGPSDPGRSDPGRSDPGAPERGPSEPGAPEHGAPEPGPSERGAFERAVAEHGDGVLRLCRSVLRDPELSADAAQETFLRLWREQVRGRAPAQVAAWLRRTAVRAAIDAFRRRGAREARLRRDPDHRGVEPVGRDDPARSAADAELRRRYEEALEQLALGQRTVFLLRHEGDMTLAEVAQALGVAVPTAKTQFARACLALQARLSAFRPGP